MKWHIVKNIQLLTNRKDLNYYNSSPVRNILTQDDANLKRKNREKDFFI